MNPEPEIRFACNEEFERLCALFTASALSAGESARLERHLATCADCRAILSEYRSLASKVVADATPASYGASGTEEEWSSTEAESQAKNFLLQNLEITKWQPQVH